MPTIRNLDGVLASSILVRGLVKKKATGIGEKAGVAGGCDLNKRIYASFLMTGLLLQADTLIMRNGNRVVGTFVSGDNRSIRINVGGHVNTYNLNEVDTIQFDSSQGNYAPNASNPNTSSSYPSNSSCVGSYCQSTQPGNYPSPGDVSSNPNYPSNPNYSSSNGSYASGGQSANSLQVPAGTQIVVRLIDPVNSETDRLGQTYRASIDDPVVVNGQTVIPRGVDAVASLIDAQKSGKIQGRTALTLDLRSVTINGRTVNVTTTGVSQESSSRGERSAKVIGGTAALGAIIGAIAGGGKGAAIGAGSGAAVGTGAEVMTSGQKVKIPAETRLTFTLQNPIGL